MIFIAMLLVFSFGHKCSKLDPDAYLYNNGSPHTKGMHKVESSQKLKNIAVTCFAEVVPNEFNILASEERRFLTAVASVCRIMHNLVPAVIFVSSHACTFPAVALDGINFHFSGPGNGLHY